MHGETTLRSPYLGNDLWLARVHPAGRFFAGLLRVAPGDLLVPGGMEGPGPRFAHCAANHGLEGPRFAEGALIDVDEDAAKHDQGGDVVYDVADCDGHPAESLSARPEDDSGDNEGDGAANDLPELHFLTGVEEACVGRIHLHFAGGDLLDVSHPARVGWCPNHGFQPIQRLECEEEDEAYAEVGMHDAA